VQKKPVSLKVYRSFQAEKRRRQTRQAFMGLAHELAETTDLAGYVLVAIDNEGEAQVHYDCGPVKPAILPAYVQEALSRIVNDQRDGQEGTSF
jgi:hypothetical protein